MSPPHSIFWLVQCMPCRSQIPCRLCPIRMLVALLILDKHLPMFSGSAPIFVEKTPFFTAYNLPKVCWFCPDCSCPGSKFSLLHFFGSMDWFEGKSTANHRFSDSIWGFPALFSFNHSIDWLSFPDWWLQTIPDIPDIITEDHHPISTVETTSESLVVLYAYCWNLPISR